MKPFYPKIVINQDFGISKYIKNIQQTKEKKISTKNELRSISKNKVTPSNTEPKPTDLM